MINEWIARIAPRRVIYWRNIALATLLTCLPMTILSGIYLYVGNQYLINQFQQENKNILQQSTKEIDEQLNHLTRFALSMVVKPLFKPDIANADFVNSYEETQQLLDTLRLIENANPAIDQAYLYIAGQNKILEPSLGLRSLDDPAQTALWQKLLQGNNDIFWEHTLDRPFITAGTGHAIVMKLPFNGQTPYGAIVLYINPNKLHSIESSDQATFLLDGEGHIVGQSAKGEQYQDTLPLISEQLAASKPTYDSESQFQVPMPSDKLIVNTVSFEKMSGIWTVVSGTPTSAITAPIAPFTQMMFIYWGIIIIAALALSWYASRRMSRPIRKIMDLFGVGKTESSSMHNEIEFIEKKWEQFQINSEQLQNHLNLSMPKVREAFINQFVLGHTVHLTEQEIHKKLDTVQLDIANKHFAVVVYQQHMHREEHQSLTPYDQQLLTYSARNIMNEMAAESASYVHTIDFIDDSIALILILPPSTHSVDEEKQSLMQLCTQMMNMMDQLLRVPATLVLNGPTYHWTDVPHVLEQARRALNYRKFNSNSQLLEASVVLEQVHSHFEFPFELEQEFTHTLNLGLEEEAIDMLTRFVGVLQDDAAPEWIVHQGLMRLKSSLYRSMLQAGYNPYTLYDGVKLQEELYALRDAQECIQWFRIKIIRPYIDLLKKSYHHSMKQIVDQVITEIEHNYMDHVSLETLALEANISVSQLSKAFKQMTGSNYMDYLTAVKMNKCKELLITTDMKINEIAESVGYQPPYFNRAFKKIEGITPGQYRNQFQSEK